MKFEATAQDTTMQGDSTDTDVVPWLIPQIHKSYNQEVILWLKTNQQMERIEKRPSRVPEQDKVEALARAVVKARVRVVEEDLAAASQMAAAAKKMGAEAVEWAVAEEMAAVAPDKH